MTARDRLLAAAARVFEEQGTKGATTKRIAQAAGVNEATLFRQFGTKEELLRVALTEAARHVMATTLPADPRDPRAELESWAREHLVGMYRASGMLRTSIGELEARPEIASRACEVPVRVARELEDYVARLCERGLASEACSIPAASAVLMGAIFSDALTRDVMPERYPYSLDEAAAVYVDVFLRGIGHSPVDGGTTDASRRYDHP